MQKTKSSGEKINLKALYGIAHNAAQNAYAPYSRFPVGAALLMSDGEVITGVNVENRSFGLTNCAERAAVFTERAKGCKTVAARAVATPASSAPVPPCGACRQVLSEFAPPEMPVIFGSSADCLVETTLGALYPYNSLHELGAR
jgi:cytidine deaminase